MDLTLIPDTDTLWQLLVWSLLLQVACGFIMKYVARRKKANEKKWFIWGLILGPLAFIAIPFI